MAANEIDGHVQQLLEWEPEVAGVVQSQCLSLAPASMLLRAGFTIPQCRRSQQSMSPFHDTASSSGFCAAEIHIASKQPSCTHVAIPPKCKEKPCLMRFFLVLGDDTFVIH